MEDVKILELVDFVNKNLKKGYSTAKIEQQLLKTGKDSIRKKLNRNNYFFSKELNQYVLGAEKEQVKINPKPIAPQQKEIIIEEENLTKDEIKILREIIINYKKENEYIKLDLEDEVVVRSVRTYKKVLEKFSKFCKTKDLNQKDALAKALINFINK